MHDQEKQLEERIDGLKARIRRELSGFSVLDISGYITPISKGFLLDDVVASVVSEHWKNPIWLVVSYDNDKGRLSYRTTGGESDDTGKHTWTANELDEDAVLAVQGFFDRLATTEHPGTETERAYEAFSDLSEQSTVLEALYRSMKGRDFTFCEQIHVVRPYTEEDRQEIWEHAQTLHPEEYRNFKLHSILERTVRGVLRRPLLGFEGIIDEEEEKRTIFWDGASFYYLADGSIELI